MEWVKTTAKTLPEAIDLALDNLGVDESEAEINVLEEPRAGLFGRTRGLARVEARVKPKPTRPKAERGRGRKNSDSKGGRSRGGKQRRPNDRAGGGNDDRSTDGKPSQRGGKRNDRSDESGNRTPKADQDVAVADGSTDADGGAEVKKARRSRGRGGQGRGGSGNGADTGGKNEAAGRQSNGSRNGGRGKSRGEGGKAANRAKSSPGSSDDLENAVEQGASVEEVASHLETFLQDLTEAFGFDSDVTIDRAEDDTLTGSVDDQIGLLVGPKGRTLDAVQELARVSCQRTVPSSVRIKVDVGGYRVKRAAALGDFARNAADRAVAEGVEIALDPMSAADRKAVHDALNEDDRVSTRSVGVDPRRRILVVPDETAADDVDTAGDEDVADEEE